MAKKGRGGKPFKVSNDPQHFLEIAKAHLTRVQEAGNAPDWADLGTYGLYCLEALVRAASLKAGETPIRTHWGKADQARNLAQRHGLPDIEDTLIELNNIRKALAYGDLAFNESEYDAPTIVATIESYFDAVGKFCS